MTSPKTILPDEIKKWIEDEAEKYNPVYASQFTAGATSLYQHLQENGRVAELEKTIHDLQDDFNELVISHHIEVERLKKLCMVAYRNATGIYHGVDVNDWWPEFKMQNNLT